MSSGQVFDYVWISVSGQVFHWSVSGQVFDCVRMSVSGQVFDYVWMSVSGQVFHLTV